MRRIVIGVSGASGAPYALSLLRFLREHGQAAGVETHLVFTKMGRLVWRDEVDIDPASFGFPIHGIGDMTAPFASGSSGFDAMAVIPCSAGCLARIAHGVSMDLVGRAADVMLKERKKLVLVLRETPYSLIQLRTMVQVTEAGAVVLAASPSFYSRPDGVDELVDTVVSRVLDQLDLDNDLMKRWEGRSSLRHHEGGS